MIEPAIFVLIGFLAAALVAMIAFPAVSRRAFRLAEGRARMLAPLSSEQARADRDALRGQYAIEIAKNQRRSLELQETLSQAQIELGRRAGELARMEAALQEKSASAARLSDEVAILFRDLQDRDVEIGTRELGLLDLTDQRNAAVVRLAVATDRIGDLLAQAADGRTLIASLEGRIAALAAELANLTRASESAALDAAVRIVDLTNDNISSRATISRLESQIADIDARHTGLRTEAEGRAAETARLRQRLADLEPMLSASEKTRESLALDSSRQGTRLLEREAEIQRLQAAHRQEVERLQARLAGAAARENELSMRIQALIVARADAETSMRIANAERDALTPQISSARERLAVAEGMLHSVSKGDATLRRAILRLGLAFVEGDPYSSPGAADAELITFARRERGPDASAERGGETHALASDR